MTALVPLIPLVVGELDISPLLAGGRSRHTSVARRQDAQHIAVFLSRTGRTWRSLDELGVIEFVDWCAEKWAPATVNRRLSTLRLLLRRLRAAGVIDGDPSIGVEGFDLGDGRPAPALTRAQARDLVTCAAADLSPRGVRDVALLRLGLRTGLRRAEILRLTPADVVDSGGHSVATIQVKRAKYLIVKLDAVRESLDEWAALAGELAGEDAADLLRRPYARGVKGPWSRVAPAGAWTVTDAAMSNSGFAGMVARRGARAGVPFPLTPHSLRSTFITLTLAGGAPLNRVQRSVGHGDPRTTGRYDALRDAMDDHPTDYLAGI